MVLTFYNDIHASCLETTKRNILKRTYVTSSAVALASGGWGIRAPGGTFWGATSC